MIYFDNAATGGYKPKAVINAVDFSLKNLSANPGRSGHLASQKAAQAVYEARESVSDFFKADGAENVVFTHNCTHAINVVLKGVLKSGDHIVISDLEHNAVMRPLSAMKTNYSMARVSLNDDVETLNNFKALLRPNTKMIFCTAASNVLGKILPLKEIGELCKENGILFGVDAAQGAGHFEIDMKKMNIDFLCIAPHKGLYCPMGFGILIAKKKIENTIIEGGTGSNSLELTQPDTLPERLESGTLNLPAICSVKPALKFVKQNFDNIIKHEDLLVKRLYNELKENCFDLYTNPYTQNYVPVLCFNVNGVNSEAVASFLNQKGFALRAGLHCAPIAHKKIGTLNQGAVRFSPSIFNNINEVDKLVYNLKFFLKKHKFTID